MQKVIVSLHSATRIAVVVALLAACGDGGPTGPIPPSELTFAPGLGVDLAAMVRTNSGLYLLDEVEGEGAVAATGDRVTVHYSGWFHDGLLFDSSVARGEPFTVQALGAGQVIPGWDEGLQGMREGGTRLLVIPSELAYGPQPVAGRTWATLVFRVEMLQVGS
jgi:FKBP-type peptidyl-prolyl cis-trans isomerase FkpA